MYKYRSTLLGHESPAELAQGYCAHKRELSFALNFDVAVFGDFAGQVFEGLEVGMARLLRLVF